MAADEGVDAIGRLAVEADGRLHEIEGGDSAGGDLDALDLEIADLGGRDQRVPDLGALGDDAAGRQ